MEKDFVDIKVSIAKIETQSNGLIEKVNKIDENLRSSFVLSAEFNPVKNIVFGLVGVILTSVLVALIALVVRNA